MARTARDRTIAFFEIVEQKGVETVRIDQFDWASLLHAISGADLDSRTWEGDQTFVGSILDFSGRFDEIDVDQHLLLHRVKDPGEWLARLDKSTGKVEDLESGQVQGFLETTAVTFLPMGNLVAMVQGSTSAPSHVSLQNWLNGIQAWRTRKLAVRPVVAQAEIERLQKATGASRVEIRIGQSKAAALKGKTGRLAKALRTLQRDYGHGVKVTMVISIPRGKGYDQDRAELLEDLNGLEEIMPGSAEVARAKLVYAQDQGEEGRRMVEFVEHHITAKAKIAAVNENGETIRVMSAVSAMLAQATLHKEELLLAVDVTI